eukprot:2617047-Lingulodinium_polyedra.AAC.1
MPHKTLCLLPANALLLGVGPVAEVANLDAPGAPLLRFSWRAGRRKRGSRPRGRPGIQRAAW